MLYRNVATPPKLLGLLGRSAHISSLKLAKSLTSNFQMNCVLGGTIAGKDTTLRQALKEQGQSLPNNLDSGVTWSNVLGQKRTINMAKHQQNWSQAISIKIPFLTHHVASHGDMLMWQNSSVTQTDRVMHSIKTYTCACKCMYICFMEVRYPYDFAEQF